jgi:hypothetical protein
VRRVCGNATIGMAGWLLLLLHLLLLSSISFSFTRQSSHLMTVPPLIPPSLGKRRREGGEDGRDSMRQSNADRREARLLVRLKLIVKVFIEPRLLPKGAHPVFPVLVIDHHKHGEGNGNEPINCIQSLCAKGII